MRMSIGKFLCMLGGAAAALQINSSALAVDTMADWTGKNNVLLGVVQPFVADEEVRNNYGLISNTAVGGQIESKVNFLNDPVEVTVDEPTDFQHIYFSDPTLEGPVLNFTTPLHMEGTISFNSPQATEPNILFGWYNSADTRHRIGFGISNLDSSSTAAIPNKLRLDFGFAASGGNLFTNVSSDGSTTQGDGISVIPNGTYQFTFDYTPGPAGSTGGTMSATVGDFFRTVTPLGTRQPWDNDFFDFDRFGIVQRATNNANQWGFYDVVFSDVTYTGGTAAPAESADFNSSGNVNGADLAIWSQNFGTATGASATFDMGNADGGSLVAPVTTDVDGGDFLIWQRTYNGGSPVGAVPEPSALALLAIGGISALMRRNRRG